MKHVQGRRMLRARPIRVVTTGAVILVLAALTVAATRHDKPSDPTAQPVPGTLPHTPGTYLGVYTAQVPVSYAGVTSFTTTTGVRPNVITYYSGWYEPFQTRFATTAAKQGAVTLVQIEPTHVSLAAIASGKYDGYLSAYAAAVRSYRHPVILSFGHEMNGSWYTWGHRHASPAEFVAAWRHIVSLFRALGAGNVTWLWTINIIDKQKDAIPDPAPWWPGSSYVTWVGIDGYYLKPSWQFAPLFGPTIAAVRELTRAPILIAETGAVPAAGQPAKIADLFAGINAYGLLGFVWFNSTDVQDFKIEGNAAAVAAFRQGAKTYKWPGS
ncbi:MAG: glycosyl hydrolase [Streptosporangiaceae bacterium]|jgi:mannan endo-1,4-beta-mannosidase